jgi:PadR family transcriptional regulator, regulatory protein AphA
MLRYILLGFILYKPSTGYELKQFLDNSTGYFWHAYHSQIYTTLTKLESDGLIRSQILESTDHLTRRLYEITPQGREAVLNWANQPLTELPKIKEDLLVRVFFSGTREIPEIQAELRLHRRLHQQQLEVYQQIATKMESIHSGEHPPTGPQSHPDINLRLNRTLGAATLRFGIAYEKMYIAWLDQLIDELDSV